MASVSESMMGRGLTDCFGGLNYYCQLVLPQQCYTWPLTGSVRNVISAAAGDVVAAFQFCFFNLIIKTCGEQRLRREVS